MSNTIDWGQGSKNNTIGWGQGAATNDINWGLSQKNSYAGETNIVGADGLAPVNTVAPVISGTATIGQTLSSTTGTWTSDTGVIGYLYQWYRGATLITGATNNTYVLTLADVAFDITCRVAATDTDGTSAYVSSNTIFLFDADYKAILDRATALSYALPTLAQQKLQNTLLMNMKADGVWAKLDVFYNFANNGGASFGTLNWKNPNSNLATLENAPAFTTNVGFTGSAGSFINTNFSGSNGTQYSLNNASRYVYMYTASGTNPIDGLLSSNGNSIRITSSNVQQINQGTLNVDSNFQYNTTRGMKSIHRTSANDVQLFNGTVSASRVAVSSTRATQNQIILRAGSAQGLHTVSMYGMGASMISENAAFVADYNTYINAI
jgi:hypothetical protein